MVERKLENALKASEERYRRLFETAQDGILILDADSGKIVDVNPFLINLLGYSHAEFMHRQLWEIGVFKDILANKDAYIELINKNYVRFDHLPLESKDGRKIEVEFVSNVYLIESTRVVQCNIRDITGRKQREAYGDTCREILSILNETENFQDSIPGVIAVLQSRTRVDAVGIRLKDGDDFPYLSQNGFSKDFLLTENSLLSRNSDGGICRDKDGGICLECTCGLVISGKTDPNNPLFTRGGSFWTNDSLPLLNLPLDQDPRHHPRNECIHQGYASVAIIPICDNDGIIGLLQFNDHAKECFTLDAVELLEGIASHIGAALTRIRMEQRLRQSEKMTAIGQLAGGIAHDFNNQLGGVIGYADMLVNRLDNPTFKQYATNILTAANRAADLTKKLLAFSRKGKYLSVPVDIHLVIGEVVALLTHSIDKQIEIHQDLIANQCTVLGDPTQLQNAFLNLAVNARDAMPTGGKLSFATSVVELQVDPVDPQLQPGLYVRVCVSDTGTGMDTETQRHIFEPFFTTKEQGKGTGLGLASTHGAVMSHHGALRCESQIGKGTTFVVCLPLLETALLVKGAESVLVPTHGEARILVVDDEEIVREVTAELLRSIGYKVTTCANGEEAVRYYQMSWEHVDLVILDMVMPKMNGRNTFVAMRKINSTVKMLLSSGHSLNGEVQCILDEGALGFIQKPFNQSTLVAEVEAALATA